MSDGFLDVWVLFKVSKCDDADLLSGSGNVDSSLSNSDKLSSSDSLKLKFDMVNSVVLLPTKCYHKYLIPGIFQ